MVGLESSQEMLICSTMFVGAVFGVLITVVCIHLFR